MASWTTMRALGSVSGWGGGSVCRGRVDHVTRNRTCVAPTAWSSSSAVLVSARVRPHEHLVRELDAANPHVQFDERGVETEHGGLLGHRQTKGPATRKATPKPPRHSSTLLGPGANAVIGDKTSAGSPWEVAANVSRRAAQEAGSPTQWITDNGGSKLKGIGNLQ
jgi:hypothetical protein